MKQRLRHPIRAIREPFGKAGLVVACIALIAALGGTALAAKGALTGKQKKEVEKIAKKVAKPGPPGATGPAGPAGKDGAAGANGTDGAPGANGVGVTTSAASSGECGSAGGVKITSASGSTHVCNGTTGFTETLPEGKTEAGTFSSGFLFAGETTENGSVGISFPIPLEAGVPSHYVPTCESGPSGEPWPEPTLAACEAEKQAVEATGLCPGSAKVPLAEPGNLCVYAGATQMPEPLAPGEEVGIRVSFIQPPQSATPGTTGTSGAILATHYEGPEGRARLNGSWAVTAE